MFRSLLLVLGIVIVPSTAESDYVIVVDVTQKYRNMFDNWLNHLDKVNNTLRDYVHASAYDKTSCLYLQSLRISHSCVDLKVQSDLTYNSPSFNKLMCERPKNMLRQLGKGKTVLYTDIDTVWLRNVLEYFQKTNENLLLQLDLYRNCAYDSCEEMTWDNCEREAKRYCDKACACLIGIRPHRDTKQLLRTWIRGCGLSKDKQDQKVFREVLSARRFSRLRLSRRFFPPQLFLSGASFFGTMGNIVPELTQKKDMLSSAYWLHNNWITGEAKKRGRFEVHGLWNITKPTVFHGQE